MSDADLVATFLEAAHATLRETIQPAVPGEHRDEVAMVANALAISARALRLAPLHADRERHLLARGERADASTGQFLTPLDCRRASVPRYGAAVLTVSPRPAGHYGGRK